MAMRAGRRQTALLKSLLGRLNDGLQAVKLLKSMARESLIGPLLEDDTRRLNRQLKRRVFSKEALMAMQEPILVLFVCSYVYVAVVMWKMPINSLLVLVFLLVQVIRSLNKIQRKYQLMITEGSALWSIREMIEDARAHEEPPSGATQPTLERAIALEGVSIGYDGQSVLDDLSLTAPVGKITAIIGDSGSGKTTLVDLITGLVRPDRGRVCIDGVPLDDLDLMSWRHMIGYVPQEMLVLHDSIRANVTLGDPGLGTSEVESALRDAGAWGFVSSLPEGVESSMGERGSLFSGGQRQRIAIARALVHRPKLLLLDEATAALDPQSEAEVWETVSQLRGKATVIAISHQPALTGVADRVYRIESGRAVEVSLGAEGNDGRRVVA
jgi:ATP-binding cassette subfamily C protein